MDLVVRAWQQAALDLGIEVTSPFQFQPSNDTNEVFSILVKGFGRPRGTIVDEFVSGSGVPSFSKWPAVAEKAGYFYSQVNPEAYARYERSHFVETLLDWGWCDGDDSPPDWYTAAYGRGRS